MARGTLVILSGPSGVGKDTVINAWHARDPRVERVVAYTTRPPRAGELPGIDYHFVTVQEFLRLAEAGAFLEFKEVHGNHYATPLHDMEEMLAAGKIAVLKIDVQGALAVMELRSDAVSVFLMPPSADELERRIRARNLDGPDVIYRRLLNAREEMALAHHYQLQLINDSVEEVVGRLVGVVQ
ncbi:guanylate kinase [Fimbriimonas ginsengisoli]|uniref:Guanylate kinase n=1 Tax=Fimbriimonas ginsengisoli Gsoil 348 TaxID=661478 RepID=A0A068NUG9_FIMGI|nr:guanylate kinase [Fimbriimonas ginsengisoli]AIE85264.1 guanylate kinase [Fimbriimonas ginsengisoli Gsoil 348]